MLARLLLFLPLVACQHSAEDYGFTDDDDVADDLGWDPLAPNVVDGTTFVGVLSCGLFGGPFDRSWIKDGDAWNEPPPGPEGPTLPRPEVMPCIAQGDNRLTWHRTTGDIDFLSGGWEHAMQPVATENLWVGEGTPTEQPSPECLEGLEAVGLDLPVSFTLSLVELTAP